jgi:hypothetical protein
MSYAIHLTPAELFEEVWEKEFAPQVAARRKAMIDAQAEAFANATIPLCGEGVRQLTPADWLQLDLIENPFIAGGTSVHLIDCIGFIWELHIENDHTTSVRNLWRRSRVARRLAVQNLEVMANAIVAYLDRMLLDPAAKQPAHDTGSNALKPEPRAYALSPLIVDVAALLGPTDPMGGELLGHTPIPRLLQYQRTAHEQKGVGRTYTEIDSLKNRCMERVNQIVAERNAPA